MENESVTVVLIKVYMVMACCNSNQLSQKVTGINSISSSHLLMSTAGCRKNQDVQPGLHNSSIANARQQLLSRWDSTVASNCTSASQHYVSCL